MHSRFARLALIGIVALALWLPLLLTQTDRASAAILAAPIDPVLQAKMQAQPGRKLPVIVQMRHGPAVVGSALQSAQQALSLLGLHGVARAALPLIGGAAGLADAAGITALSLLPGVAYIAEDAQVRGHVDPSDLGTAYPIAIEAQRVWLTGGTGTGVTVAVLDSGIAANPDLGNRVLARVNLADRISGSSDPGGHGTHVAGIIAGNGAASAGEFVGVAPSANLVDVRVLDGEGHGLTSSIVLGIQWVLDHRQQYNIRVVNLSLGAPPRANYRLDPLASAVEMAWLRGLVVVAASGNTAGVVDSPGADPYVITVGATDDRQTLPIGDDLVGSFSGWGRPAGSVAKPELVAPGRRIVSLRVPGSTLDQLLPDRRVSAANGASYMRLSGTSMATGVISGQVALLLQRQPWLTPDQVKAVLTGTTRSFGQSSGTVAPRAQIGSGLADAYLAVNSGSRGEANQGLRPSDFTASTLYSALYGEPLRWKNGLLGGLLWGLLSWANLTWDNLAWDNLAWDYIDWANIAWDNIAWDNIAWDNIAWDNIAWDNIAWDNIAWDSARYD
jgi:serine protease AprX